MGLSAEEKKEVKTLAKAGAWDDIEQKFGAKTLKLARDYIAKKGAHAGANDDEGAEGGNADDNAPAAQTVVVTPGREAPEVSSEDFASASVEPKSPSALQPVKPKKSMLSAFAAAAAPITVLSPVAVVEAVGSDNASATGGDVDGAAPPPVIDLETTLAGDTSLPAQAAPAIVKKKKLGLGLVKKADAPVADGGEAADANGAAAAPPVPKPKALKKPKPAAPKPAAEAEAGADGEAGAAADFPNPGTEADADMAAPAPVKPKGIKLGLVKKAKPVVLQAGEAGPDGVGLEAKVKKAKKQKSADDSSAVASGKPSKKSKASSDAADGKSEKVKAKRAPSAFMFFVSSKRSEVIASNPGIAFADVGRKLGEMWKALTDDDKVVYNQQHEAAKAKLSADAPTPVNDDDDAMDGGAGAGGAISEENIGDGFVRKRKGAEKKQKKKSSGVKSASVASSSAYGAGYGAGAGKKAKKSKAKRASKEGEADSDSDGDSGSYNGSDGEDGAGGAGSKRKRGDQRQKKGRKHHDEDVILADDDDEFEEDEESKIFYDDPRAAAIAAAEARQREGKAAKVKNGIIEDGEAGSHPMPRDTGRMNYKPYLFKEGERVGLILPAYIDWRTEMADAAADPEAAANKYYGGDEELAGRMAEGHAIVKLMEAQGLVTPHHLEPYHNWTKTGVLWGTVAKIAQTSKSALKTKGGAGSGVDESFASSSAGGDGDDAMSDGGSSIGNVSQAFSQTFTTQANRDVGAMSRSKGSKRNAWFMVSLQLSETATTRGRFRQDQTYDNEEDEEDMENGDGLTGGAAAYNSRKHKQDVSDGPVITIPWLVPEHQLVDNAWIIRSIPYIDAEDRDLRPGTQIRKKFPAPNGPSNTKAEWLEGRVYYSAPRKQDKDRGWSASIYQSMRVVWYEQDADTREWYIETMQTSNVASRWELSTDKQPFVKSENVHAFCDDADLAFNSPLEVIDYLTTTEAAGIFKAPVPKSVPQYHARIKTPMDLGTIKKRALAGRYEEPMAAASSSSSSSAEPRLGVSALWEDLRQVIKNAKIFNEPDRMEWRMADMLECEVRRVKKIFSSGKGSGAASSSSSAGAGAGSSSSSGHRRSVSIASIGSDGSDAVAASQGWFGSQDNIDAELEAEEASSAAAAASSSAAAAGTKTKVAKKKISKEVAAELRASTAIEDPELSMLDAQELVSSASASAAAALEEDDSILVGYEGGLSKVAGFKFEGAPASSTSSSAAAAAAMPPPPPKLPKAKAKPMATAAAQVAQSPSRAHEEDFDLSQPLSQEEAAELEGL